MLYVPSECQFSLRWSLEINGKTLCKQAAFIAEFDATLTVVWWQDEYTDDIIWRVDAIEPDAGYIIDAESDPELWALIERAVKADKSLDERVLEEVQERLS